jgi:putative lipoprotein
MRQLFIALTLFAGLLVLGGCGGSTEEDSGESTVTGTVTYRERIALPDDTIVTVQIRDTSLADSIDVTIGEQVIETGGQQVPIPYEVPYDADEIVENHTYTMRARITDADGNLLFTNDTAIPVITRDSPTEDVEIMVVQVGG